MNYVLWSLLLPEVTFCSSVATLVVSPGLSIQSNFNSLKTTDGFGAACASGNWEHPLLLHFPVLSTCLDEIWGASGAGCVYL